MCRCYRTTSLSASTTGCCPKEKARGFRSHLSSGLKVWRTRHWDLLGPFPSWYPRRIHQFIGTLISRNTWTTTLVKGSMEPRPWHLSGSDANSWSWCPEVLWSRLLCVRLMILGNFPCLCFFFFLYPWTVEKSIVEFLKWYQDTLWDANS